MNPFDWRGPQFLGLYIVVSGIGVVLMYLVARGLLTNSPRLPSGEGRKRLRDPYLLAYLRGGVPETIKTVLFSLSRRKLVTATPVRLSVTDSRDAVQAVSNPLEKAVLARCAAGREGLEIVRDSGLKHAVENYAEPLRETGLVANAEEFSRRMPALLAIGGTLLAGGAIKVGYALLHGHTNVAFLVALTGFALFLVFEAFRRRRTSAGDRALSDQQTLFGRLKNRAKRLAADGATDEAVIVAAAFGLSELPTSGNAFLSNLKRQLSKNQNSSGSCSSGCGSSCGGGGCGGGCGGCGS